MSYGFGAIASQLWGTGSDFILSDYFSNPATKTVSFWVKSPAPANLNNYNAQSIISKPVSNSSESYSLLSDGTKILLAIDSPSGTTGSEFSVWYTPPSGVDLTLGAFICVVWESGSTWISKVLPKVYMNGLEATQNLYRTQPTINSLPPSSSPTNPWNIGRQKNPYGFDYAKIQIAEFAIWNRLLSVTDAISISNGNAANKYTDGLQCYLPLNNDLVNWITQVAGTNTGAIVRNHPTVLQATNPVRPTPPAPPDQTLLDSGFFIGNSMTDAIRSDETTGLPALINQGGRVAQFARHVIPGSPIDFGVSPNWLLMDASAGGFTTDPYGNTRTALKANPWKFVSFQPFDRQLTADTTNLGILIDETLTLTANAAYPTKFFIYSRTPRTLNQLWQGSEYKTRWDRVYNSSGTNQPEECRNYYEQLTTALRTAKPGKTIRLVPVGDVFYALNDLAIAGNLPGVANVYDFYAKVDGSNAWDSIHLTRFGSYVVALTYYSCITEKTPIGINPTDSFKVNNVALTATQATKIQETVRDVIIAKSAFTGITEFNTVTPTPTPNPVPGGLTLTNTILSLKPGLSAYIQFVNIDGTPYTIPDAATLAGVVITPYKTKIADLELVKMDQTVIATKGFIKVTLPNTLPVRAQINRQCFYDLEITIPGGTPKYKEFSELRIDYSPTRELKLDAVASIIML
jgi:hypothetical protein